jgi:hypothetical protein
MVILFSQQDIFLVMGLCRYARQEIRPVQAFWLYEACCVCRAYAESGATHSTADAPEGGTTERPAQSSSATTQMCIRVPTSHVRESYDPFSRNWRPPDATDCTRPSPTRLD